MPNVARIFICLVGNKRCPDVTGSCDCMTISGVVNVGAGVLKGLQALSDDWWVMLPSFPPRY